MRETTDKYKLLVHFYRAKQAYQTFATIYHSNIFTFLQIYPDLLQFTYKADLKMPTLQKIRRALLVTFRMSGALYSTTLYCTALCCIVAI